MEKSDISIYLKKNYSIRIYRECHMNVIIPTDERI